MSSVCVYVCKTVNSLEFLVQFLLLLVISTKYKRDRCTKSSLIISCVHSVYELTQGTMSNWVGYAVSVNCGEPLGCYQGTILEADGNTITLTKAFRNGFPYPKSQVTLKYDTATFLFTSFTNVLFLGYHLLRFPALQISRI